MSFVWYKNLNRSFFCFVTMHAFVRQTDTFLIASPRWHSMQRWKNCTSQLPTTSQHLSPTRILPCNQTNVRIHAHTNTYPHRPTRLPHGLVK